MSSKASSKTDHALVLDIGTTGIKSVLFDAKLHVVSRTYKRLPKFESKRGWVEQNPYDYLDISRQLLKSCVKKSGVSPRRIQGFGITNQRETTILWDKITGRPVHPAIVWEDSRTKKYCAKLKKRHEKYVHDRTGLTIDSYFSASKIRWILDHAPEAKRLNEEKALLFGNVDTWVFWNLLEKNPHVTDFTNASRTLLFDIRKKMWDTKLQSIFGVDSSMLPNVQSSRSSFGKLSKNVLGVTVPALADCGDQQASMVAAGTQTGTTKVTYGTGSFMMQVTGTRFVSHKLFFTTLAPHHNSPVFALEGKVSGSGARVDANLKKPQALRRIIQGIVNDVDIYVQKLPKKPKKIFLDGGITRYKDLPDMQRKKSGIPVEKQPIPDGTSLGVAKLILNRFE